MTNWKKISTIALFLLVVMTFFAPKALALKKLVRKPHARVAGMSFSKASLSRPTHSVIITFMNLDKVTHVDYALSYMANGIAQGAIGSFTPGGQSTESRDLYFGTCSKGVCTPHYGITHVTLTITTTLTNGNTNTKRYVIKNI